MEDFACLSCSFTISVDSNFCTFCGDSVDALDSLVTSYFRKGFQYESIVKFLSKFNGINISLRTLKSKLRELGLKRRSVNADLDSVRQRIRELLDGPNCMGGYRSIWHTLHREGIQVPRTHVQHLAKAANCEEQDVYGADHTIHLDLTIAGISTVMTNSSLMASLYMAA